MATRATRLATGITVRFKTGVPVDGRPIPEDAGSWHDATWTYADGTAVPPEVVEQVQCGITRTFLEHLPPEAKEVMKLLVAHNHSGLASRWLHEYWRDGATKDTTKRVVAALRAIARAERKRAAKPSKRTANRDATP